MPIIGEKTGHDKIVPLSRSKHNKNSQPSNTLNLEATMEDMVGVRDLKRFQPIDDIQQQ